MPKIKKTMVCKSIDHFEIDSTLVHTYMPELGDVAIFEILEIGKHKTIQSPSKRNVHLVEGDLIMAAFANRYATEQFEGYIPDRPTEILDILGAGGAVGLVKSKNAGLEFIEPTKIRLVGYAVNERGAVVNTLYHQQPCEAFTGIIPNDARVILSIGATMDSGKTTTAAYLVAGLKKTGSKVAYMKLTGTCFSKDQDLVYDCGADKTVDFSDAGYPSTYLCSKSEILDLYQTLLGMLAAVQPDYIVIEVADGIMQRETNFLIRDRAFMGTIQDVVFSSGDSLAAFYGESYLASLGIPIAAFCGCFTMSPLLIEEVRAYSSVPVLTLDDLREVDLFPRIQIPVMI